MKYLLRHKPSTAAHIWYEDKEDTACRMYSTGGLKSKKYKVHDNSHGKKICQNCQRNISQDNIAKEVRDFGIIPYSILINKNISLAAKGMFAYLFSNRVQGVDFNELYDYDKNCNKLIQELEDNGLVVIHLGEQDEPKIGNIMKYEILVMP